MSQYFTTGRDKYHENGIIVARNHEDLGREISDEEERGEVFLMVPVNSSAISSQTAREIADALIEVADEWDRAKELYAEEQKRKQAEKEKSAERILTKLPIGGRFVNTSIVSGAYYVKIGSNDALYVSPYGNARPIDRDIRKLSEYFDEQIEVLP